jgi:hypothetical protein
MYIHACAEAQPVEDTDLGLELPLKSEQRSEDGGDEDKDA